MENYKLVVDLKFNLCKYSDKFLFVQVMSNT